MLCIAAVKLWKLHLLTSQAYSSSGFVLLPYQGGVGLPDDNPVRHIRDSLPTNLQAEGAAWSRVHGPGFSWVQEWGQCMAVVSTYFCDPSGSSIAEVLRTWAVGVKNAEYLLPYCVSSTKLVPQDSERGCSDVQDRFLREGLQQWWTLYTLTAAMNNHCNSFIKTKPEKHLIM